MNPIRGNLKGNNTQNKTPTQSFANYFLSNKGNNDKINWIESNGYFNYVADLDNSDNIDLKDFSRLILGNNTWENVDIPWEPTQTQPDNNGVIEENAGGNVVLTFPRPIDQTNINKNDFKIKLGDDEVANSINKITPNQKNLTFELNKDSKWSTDNKEYKIEHTANLMEYSDNVNGEGIKIFDFEKTFEIQDSFKPTAIVQDAGGIINSGDKTKNKNITLNIDLSHIPRSANGTITQLNFADNFEISGSTSGTEFLPNSNKSYTINFKNLNDDTYNFKLVKDKFYSHSGNSNIERPFTFTVKTSVSKPTANASKSNVTGTENFNITGTAEPGTTITLFKGNASTNTTTTADGNGDYAFNNLSINADGTINYYVISEDSVGNTSTSDQISVTRTAPPAIELHSNTSTGVLFIKINKILRTNDSGVVVEEAATAANNNRRSYEMYMNKEVTDTLFYSILANGGSYTNDPNNKIDNFGQAITIGPGNAQDTSYQAGKNLKIVGQGGNGTFTGKYGAFSGGNNASLPPIGQWQPIMKIEPADAIPLKDEILNFPSSSGKVGEIILQDKITLTNSANDP